MTDVRNRIQDGSSSSEDEEAPSSSAKGPSPVDDPPAGTAPRTIKAMKAPLRKTRAGQSAKREQGKLRNQKFRAKKKTQQQEAGDAGE